jgi:hypothetical protein
MSGGSSGEPLPDEWEPLDDDRPADKARFMVSLGRLQLAALRDHAERNGLSVAELVRRAIDDYLDARRP